MHVYAEIDLSNHRASIRAGSHPDSVEVAVVRLEAGDLVVDLKGVPATVDANRLLEAVAMANEALAG